MVVIKDNTCSEHCWKGLGEDQPTLLSGAKCPENMPLQPKVMRLREIALLSKLPSRLFQS